MLPLVERGRILASALLNETKQWLAVTSIKCGCALLGSTYPASPLSGDWQCVEKTEKESPSNPMGMQIPWP